jgi:hypothetical protein
MRKNVMLLGSLTALFLLIQTTILELHRAGGRGGAPHPPATEGPHWGMGGVRTDGAAEGQDPPLQQD